MAVRFSADGQDYTSTASVPNGNYTIVCWGMLSADQDNEQTFWTTANGTTSGHILGTTNDGTTLFFSSPGGSVTGVSLTLDTWYRLAVTVNGTTATLYYGEASAALTSASATVSAASGYVTFQIGESQFTGEWLNGRVANVKHYSAVLTEAEIETEVWSWAAVRTANLVRHHKLQVPETTDYSGNGNTLTGGAGASAADDPPIPQIVLPDVAAAAGSAPDGSTSSATAISAANATGAAVAPRLAAIAASAAANATAAAVAPRLAAIAASAAANATGAATAATLAAVTASAGTAVATASVNVSAVSVGLPLAVDQAGQATGRAYDVTAIVAGSHVSPGVAQSAGYANDAAILTSGSIISVTAETATGWVTANGAQADGVDGGVGGDSSQIPDTAHVSGSAFSARWQVTLRPVTAGATGRANVPTVMGLGRPHKPRAGAPQVIPSVMVGAPVVAGSGAHAGEPALV